MDEPQISSKFQKVLDLVMSDLTSIRTGRANPALVEGIVVPAYGGTQRLKINELASITTPDAQSIVIDPWDKSIIGDIRKGIEMANVGLNPSIDGEIIRLIIPPMTGEDRQKYVKLLSTKIENGKIMLRQIRGDVMHDIKEKFEAKELSEDEKFAAEKSLQDQTDEFVAKLVAMEESKKAELLQI